MRKSFFMNGLGAIAGFIAGSLLIFSGNASADDPTLPSIPSIDPGRIGQRFVPPEGRVTDSRAPIVSKKGEVIRKKEEIKAGVAGKEGMAGPAQKKTEKPAKVVKFRLTSVVLQGITVYSAADLQKYYQSYIGKEISLEDLEKIADAVTDRYRSDGYVLSRAIVPAQNIDKGAVQIRVVEGFVSEVYIEGNVKGAQKIIGQYIAKIKQMRPLQMKKLERYMLLMNDLPGLQIKSVLSPSPTVVGAAELTLITEQSKFSADVSFDNRSTRYLGPNEVIASVEIDDVTHAADRLLVQTVNTPNSNEMRFVQVNYQRPFGSSGLRLTVNGNLAETHPGFIIKPLQLVGRSKDFSVGLDYPIIRSRAQNVSVFAKFEWLDSYTRMTIVPPPNTLFYDHIRSLRVGFNYDSVDSARGINNARIELSKGLKLFGASPMSPETPLSRVNARSDYTKLVVMLSRLQALDSNNRFSLLAAVNAQYGFNQQLLSAEEFSFGGSLFGRGYDNSEITGDSGVSGKLELRANTHPNLGILHNIQYYAFYDAGIIWNNGISAQNRSQPLRDSATSAGAGFRAAFDKYLYANFEAAKPLTRRVDSEVAAGNNGKGWRFFFGLGAHI
jgi:hemolysin activation/secretion protein